MATLLQFPVSYLLDTMLILGSPCDTVVKNKSANAGDLGDMGSIPGSGKFPGVGTGNTLSILTWKIPWTEESAGNSPLDLKESDRTEQTHDA